MTRKKVTLAYITNDSERRASFRKRKRGLIKKVSELSTLCDVDACAIIYSPYDPEPEVWPSRAGAQEVLARFRRLSEMDKRKKMVNQESFTRQRIKKAEEQLRRLQKENKRREMEKFMFQCLAGNASLNQFDLRNSAEMGWVIDQTLRDVQSRMDALKVNGLDSSNSGAMAVEAVAPPPPPAVAPLTGDENMEGYLLNHLVQGGNGLGWDFGVLPYPYIFNNSNEIGARPE
ncbi:agamous-like mads-box protein agl80 [Phtheirospermum japonicum]|uniref:Agamous-like mads-box protein agl80 n=1 Tax=Phtheirospermum japonicum TaxID=374723 RepID=A0A830CUR8_9LAMI|nr:agamous-like mads-box protein agl80 [Phtheirospermum japonicum]